MATLNSIQRALDDFAIGTLKVARNRICLAVEEGGLGLVKLDDFLASQQFTWVLKADLSRRDNWRVDLHTITDGNCLSLTMQFQLSLALTGTALTVTNRPGKIRMLLTCRTYLTNAILTC